MQTFLDLLEKIQEVDPEKAFEQIARIFLSINQMNSESAIAAYQSLMMFRVRLNIKPSLYGPDDFGRLRRAIIGRLMILTSEVPRDKRRNFVRAIRFATDIPVETFLPLLDGAD